MIQSAPAPLIEDLEFYGQQAMSYHKTLCTQMLEEKATHLALPQGTFLVKYFYGGYNYFEDAACARLTVRGHLVETEEKLADRFFAKISQPIQALADKYLSVSGAMSSLQDLKDIDTAVTAFLKGFVDSGEIASAGVTIHSAPSFNGDFVPTCTVQIAHHQNTSSFHIYSWVSSIVEVVFTDKPTLEREEAISYLFSKTFTRKLGHPRATAKLHGRDMDWDTFTATRNADGSLSRIAFRGKWADA